MPRLISTYARSLAACYLDSPEASAEERLLERAWHAFCRRCNLQPDETLEAFLRAGEPRPDDPAPDPREVCRRISAGYYRASKHARAAAQSALRT